MADTPKMNLSELRAIAQAALDDDPEEWFPPGVVKSYTRHCLGDIEDAHIATFSPATVLRLLDVAEKARAMMAAYDVLDENSPTGEFAGNEYLPGAVAATAALRDALKGVE